MLAPLFATGGTIASRPDTTGGLKASLGGQALLEAAGLSCPAIDLCCLPSPQIGPKQWDELATAVLSYPSDTCVISHGTDTLEYTAAALHFALQGREKIAVITGAMKAPGEGDSDGPANLRAAYGWLEPLQRAGLSGVFVAQGDRLWYGPRVQKRGYGPLGGFCSPCGIDLAPCLRGERPLPEGLLEAARAPALAPFNGFNERVALLALAPGLSAEIALAALETVEALVLHSYGAGGGPVDGPSDLRPLLSRAAEQGKSVINTSAAADGVNLTLYSNGRQLAALGLIGAGRLTPAAALAKVSWCLAAGLDPAKAFIRPGGENLAL